MNKTQIGDLVYRPIQFIGSKLRSLDMIVETSLALSPSSKNVWDMFSGSSIVSQAYANNGYKVVSTDAMNFSVICANALLGIGYHRSDDDFWSELNFDELNKYKNN